MNRSATNKYDEDKLGQIKLDFVLKWLYLENENKEPNVRSGKTHWSDEVQANFHLNHSNSARFGSNLTRSRIDPS